MASLNTLKQLILQDSDESIPSIVLYSGEFPKPIFDMFSHIVPAPIQPAYDDIARPDLLVIRRIDVPFLNAIVDDAIERNPNVLVWFDLVLRADEEDLKYKQLMEKLETKAVSVENGSIAMYSAHGGHLVVNEAQNVWIVHTDPQYRDRYLDKAFRGKGVAIANAGSVPGITGEKNVSAVLVNAENAELETALEHYATLASKPLVIVDSLEYKNTSMLCEKLGLDYVDINLSVAIASDWDEDVYGEIRACLNGERAAQLFAGEQKYLDMVLRFSPNSEAFILGLQRERDDVIESIRWYLKLFGRERTVRSADAKYLGNDWFFESIRAFWPEVGGAAIDAIFCSQKAWPNDILGGVPFFAIAERTKIMDTLIMAAKPGHIDMYRAQMLRIHVHEKLFPEVSKEVSKTVLRDFMLMCKEAAALGKKLGVDGSEPTDLFTRYRSNYKPV